MAGNTSAGAGESSAQDRSGSQDSGVSAPRGARTNQGSLIKEVLKNFTVEKFNGVDRVEGAARPDLRCRNVDAGEGAVRVALERGRAGATCFGQNARPVREVGNRGNHLPGADQVLEDAIAAWTMTPRKELLDDVRAAPINEVCSASGHALKVAGAGRAAFKGADGKPVVLHDVLLVPDLKANLISLRKLAKAGVSTSTDGARTYKGQLRNRVLWDLHESKDVYRSMSKKPLELVHMDLVGPLPVQGHKGERYFLTIVDDWSRLTWAYPLKQKDHAASTIKEDWLPFIEKQAECVVKRIRTDRGGEFLGAEMTAWLKKQGIQRELTTAYTPQSNGVAERANRTILETARALLIESGVGNSMWPHAVRHATVAKNRVLNKVGNESWVPLERWLGRKPLVDMLRVFGCMAVAHVPKKYR
ncbi:unnamed protein product, partial [Closterium sp. NIES-53]